MSFLRPFPIVNKKSPHSWRLSILNKFRKLLLEFSIFVLELVDTTGSIQ